NEIVLEEQRSVSSNAQTARVGELPRRTALCCALRSHVASMVRTHANHRRCEHAKANVAIEHDLDDCSGALTRRRLPRNRQTPARVDPSFHGDARSKK